MYHTREKWYKSIHFFYKIFSVTLLPQMGPTETVATGVTYWYHQWNKGERETLISLRLSTQAHTCLDSWEYRCPLHIPWFHWLFSLFHLYCIGFSACFILFLACFHWQGRLRPSVSPWFYTCFTSKNKGLPVFTCDSLSFSILFLVGFLSKSFQVTSPRCQWH